jgi:hypothetical protein
MSGADVLPERLFTAVAAATVFTIMFDPGLAIVPGEFSWVARDRAKAVFGAPPFLDQSHKPLLRRRAGAKPDTANGGFLAACREQEVYGWSRAEVSARPQTNVASMLMSQRQAVCEPCPLAQARSKLPTSQSAPGCFPAGVPSAGITRRLASCCVCNRSSCNDRSPRATHRSGGLPRVPFGSQIPGYNLDKYAQLLESSGSPTRARTWDLRIRNPVVT